tara:strand:- start:4836 stop:6266 length:1431 start_codon:yes stop_codon:yes gene_type:complete
MGNSSSKSTSNYSDVIKLVEDVAINYTTTLNLKNISLLTKSPEEYKNSCDDLIFVSSQLLQENLKPVHIELLQERIKGNINPRNHKLVSLSKDGIDNSKILTPEAREIACNSIVTFYTKIAHLYAAIVRVLNPSITYYDGNVKKTEDLLDSIKKELPREIEIIDEKISLCSKRISFLGSTIGENNYSKLDNIFSTGKQFSLNNKICAINLKSNNEKKDTLGDEFGIYELEQLYYEKDKYGRLVKPSQDSPKYVNYKNTLFDLYKVFTLSSKSKRDDFDKKTDEEKIQEVGNIRFADIELRDYDDLCNEDFSNSISEIESSNSENIIDENKTYTASYNSYDYKSEPDREFAKKYIENLKELHDENKKQTQKILEILNEIFQKDASNKIIINPDLVEDTLDKTIEKSREMIKELYIKCELKYLEGIEQYKNIKKHIQLMSGNNRTLATDFNELPEESFQSEKLVANNSVKNSTNEMAN